VKRFVVGELDAKKRLDVFVVEQWTDLSRAFVQKLCDENKILVEGDSQKPGYKLKVGQKVQIDYDGSELERIPEIDIPVLYEDDECVVINKPAGLLSHSKGAFNPEATVATWMRSKVQAGLEGGDQQRMGIVHRLDRGTSGVMIVAKNPTSLAWLQKQFSTRKVKKTYIAIAEGKLSPAEAIIDMPIERNPKKPQTFRVGANGKPAKTQYKVIEVAGSESSIVSLVELKPETGRTHQLRVHLKQLGHPIVGDAFYDGRSAERLFLHAQNLELTLPNRERRVFTSPLPEEFHKYMSNSA